MDVGLSDLEILAAQSPSNGALVSVVHGSQWGSPLLLFVETVELFGSFESQPTGSAFKRIPVSIREQVAPDLYLLLAFDVSEQKKSPYASLDEVLE